MFQRKLLIVLEILGKTNLDLLDFTLLSVYLSLSICLHSTPWELHWVQH